ncbi:PREDICTED: piezo-type mechanosensitive ion channel component 2-like [Wasmannia auropunctata]|uniref:piezo-type mechanosensitive ion channel component 2-like n=1 Tax=Wasmannia auropunctata TaxID=64793 RepID=UPI0005ED81E8|nr:PREDICTED: piezo-type mechanosensitive ion channel component 2-like [Wasmannia auropunctata]
MTKAYWLNVALLRVILPAILAGCTIWRPVGLSIVYLGLMLYSPMVPIPTHKTMTGHTGIYLKTCICLAFLVVIAQITFHIVLLSLPPYGYFLQNCVFLEKLFRHIGFVKLDSASVWEVFYWLTPELLVLPTVLAVYFICRFLTQRDVNDEQNEAARQQENDSQRQKTEDSTAKIINFLGNIGTYVVLASLCCVAALKPSIEASFYFLVFLGAATCWACNKELRKGFSVICRIIMVIVIVHIVTLLAYQNEWPQEILPVNGTWSRYLALAAVYHTNCSDPRNVEYTDDADWLIYGYALRLFWLYYILALQSQFLSRKPALQAKEAKRLSGRLENLDTPLSRHVSIRRRTPSQRWQSARRKARKPVVDSPLATIDERTPLMRFGSGRAGLLQDSATGSIIVNQDGQQDDNIQMQSLSEGTSDETQGIVEQIIMAVYAIFQLIANSSYLATNIIMMTWSIMYHSWTTFVLLLWALILWMVPNKRASMMKCSPFIVFYATLLLLGQYVYSMELNDEELPIEISDVKISEIGFSKTEYRWHLIVKCLFISMFWITMRQYMAERKQQRRSSALRDMVAPLHVSVSTATTAMNHEVTEIKSKFMKNVGKLLQDFMTRFWIAIVAIMLFICGITGERMTMFRIVYMSLFLIFVITFQVSYWEPARPESSFRRASLGYSPSLNIPVSSPTDVTLTENEKHTIYTLKQLKHMSKLERIALLRKVTKHLVNFYNYTWLFLEIHMQKIVFISFVLLCINDVCAINFFFIAAVVIVINFERNIQIKSINAMAAIVSLLMVTKMLYQIQYINHKNWNVNCTKPDEDHEYASNNTEYNIAEWFGMKKADPGMLPDLLKGYIGIVTVTTFRKIIRVRQWFYRHNKGESLDTPQVMFPTITRMDADKGIPECLKFLFNYGFYKFGLEMCLMAIVTLIGTRLDFYSVLYSMWLLLFFSLKRKTVARIWPCFRSFAIIVLPIQYAIVVAPPSWLCIDYPWNESKIMRDLQEWMYLPDPDFQPNSRKLIYDFILLLMIVRQSLVFHIEQQNLQSGSNFVAGHNYSVFQDMEKPNFVNPVKDYVSHIHSWLDVVKRGSMMSLMWVTLSIMFLAGTKRTNLFSLGYLIGAFIFLWQGSSFYLRPMRTILKWWNMLIGYCVIVIFSKAVLQGVGCVFDKDVKHSACWLVQLLSIVCLNKFKSESTKEIVLDPDKCTVTTEDIGMVWDGLCFAFLLIQKRLFKSYYFFHIVDETKAMSILASRGAELLEELHQRRIEIQENVEKTVLEKLKFKMDKIKANQQRIQGPSYRDPQAHKVEERQAPLARTSSVSSCVSSGHTPPQGYQTPLDEDDDEPPPLTPRAASLLQAPTPNSAVMTVSLEGYLEPTRISFGSPPSSELNPRGPSPDETFPVFSPPPYNRGTSVDRSLTSNMRHRRQSSLPVWSTWMNSDPRQSIISTASRSPHSHHTYELYPGTRPLYRIRTPQNNREAIRSGDYYMFDDMDDDDVTDLIPDSDIEKREKELRRELEKQGRRMTVSELMNTLIKTDIEIATHVAMYGGTEKDALRLRRRSVPLTRKKSSMSYLSARSETDTAMATDGPDRTSLTSVEMETEEKEATDLAKTPEPSDGEEEKKLEVKKSDEKEEEQKKVSFFTYFKFLLVMINSTLISMTRYLNRFSHDYRYIRKVLAKEKKILKAKPDFRMGTRLGINQMWQPIPLMQERSATNGDTEEQYDPGEGPSQSHPQDERKESSLAVPHIRILAPSLERGLDMSSSSTLFSHVLAVQQDEEIGELSEVDQPPIIQLAASIWFAILAHSSLLCYFMVFLHQIKNASVLSTPLPLMVFLWGSLTIPRPSKNFWVTMIAYIEAIVIIKCIFQLEFISWNRKAPPNYPLYLPRIFGVIKNSNYALWDLLLLLILFFHRFMLKSLGQWTTTSTLKPRKIVPSQLPVVPLKPPSSDKEQEVGIQEESDSHVEIKESQKQSSNHHVADDTDNVPPMTDENKEIIQGEEHPHTALSKTFHTAITKHAKPMKNFFKRIIDPAGKEKTNVYAYMFLCDFFNFLLLIFGFSAFGTQQGDGGVTAYFQENRVPMPFLLMLLLQFALIVIDRALFLRKSIVGKLIFQYCLVFGVHLWMFFILPSVTDRQFNDNLPPQIWYMVKCFYLLLAAYQLRQGYPTRILGNFLCKKYSIVNYVLFKGFMLVPFLFELRAVMDWIWTDTSMTVMDWFKMEDVFASIYQIKCMRGVESDFPQPRGVKKKQMSKYLVGGSVLLLIIGLIWFPLLLFALGSTVGTSNLPYDVSMKIRIGPYEPIYSMSAQGDSSIIKYSEAQYKKLTNIYSTDKSAVTFFENYVYSDVAAVKFSTFSGTRWDISPPDKERLKIELASNNTNVTVHVEWTVSRKTDLKDASGVTTTVRDVKLFPYVDGKFNPIRQTLVDMLSEDPSATNATIILKSAFPKFLKVTSKTTRVPWQLMEPLHFASLDKSDEESYLYRNMSVQLSTDKECCDRKQWWIVREECTGSLYKDFLSKIPLNDCNNTMMFLFNDKAFPESLSFISGFGILGLYTTAVIVISQMMRKIVSDMAPKIMFDDLPYVDRILRLCLDIYLVRESGDLCLEEDLFAKLIFLYRSPETLIRWTRPPEEGERTDNEDQDEEAEEILDEERRQAEPSRLSHRH